MSAQIMNAKTKGEKAKDGKNTLALQRAQSAVLSRDYTLAIRLYNKIVTTEPDNVDVLSKLASVYVRSGNDEKALKVYLVLQRKNPDSFDALNSLGGIYRRLGHYDESIKVLETALKSGENIEALNYNMGFTYKFMGKYNEAAECFENVIDGNANDVLAYNHLGSIEDLRGNPAKAQSIFSRGLQIDPNHPILHYNAALSYVSQKKYAQAKKHYQSALRAKPGWGEVMEKYAQLLNRMNNKDEAKKILKQAVTLNPSNVQSHISLGDFYKAKVDYPKAEKAYISALEIDFENNVASNNLAEVYEKQRKNAEAVEVFDRLEKQNPSDNQLALRYAKALLSLNRLNDAIERIEKVRNTEPNSIDALNVLGQHSIRNGEKKKAQDCFNQISQLDSNAISYLLDNAEQFAHIGDFGAAKKLVKKYLERKPNDSMAWAALGWNHKDTEQYKAALLAWEHCLELDKENTSILEEVVGLSPYLSSDPVAMEIISKLVNAHSDDSNLENIESILAARENALKNVDEDESSASSEQNPYMLELDYSEDEEEEEEEDEPFDGLLNLDINSKGDFPDDYDALILEESEEEPTEEDEKEHFDLASLVPSDEPYDFDPEFEKTDMFDDKDSSQYDPIEEQEYLGVDGYGFEDDDISDEEDEAPKTIPFVEPPVIDTPVEPEPLPPPPKPEPPPPPKPEPPPQNIEEEFEDEILTSEIELDSDADIINASTMGNEDLNESEGSIGNTDELDSEGESDSHLDFEDEPDMDSEMEEELTPDSMIDDSFDLPLEEEDDELPEQADSEDEVVADDFDELVDDDLLDDEISEDKELDVIDDADIDLPEDTEPEEIIATEDDLLMEQVKKVLHQSFSSPPVKKFDNPVEMFGLLRNLCTCLPSEKKDALFSNFGNEKLNYVVTRISGKPGLLAAANAHHLSGEF